MNKDQAENKAMGKAMEIASEFSIRIDVGHHGHIWILASEQYRRVRSNPLREWNLALSWVEAERIVRLISGV